MASHSQRISLLASFIASVIKQRGIPSGGTSGQVLTKTGAADYTFGWSTAQSNFAFSPAPLVSQWLMRAASTVFNNWDAGADGQGFTSYFYLPQGTYDQVSFQVTTAGSAGAVARCVVYSNVNQAPGTLLGDTGQIDVSTVGVKVGTLSSPIVVGPGGALVWTAVINQNNASTRAKYYRVYTASGENTLVYGGTPTNFGDIYLGSRQFSGVTGAPPTSLTLSTSTTDSTVRLAFRRSA